MPQMFNQSEQSKSIKRINERMKQLAKMQSAENPYLSPYSRAIRETGVEFTKRNGQYVIRNTQENQKRVEQLEKKLAKYHAKTASEIKRETKKELKREAQEIAKKKPQKERKKFIKEYTAPRKVQERIKEHLQNETISDMLQFLYTADPEQGQKLGGELSDLTRGVTQGEQDAGGIYDTFGRIRDATRAAQLNALADTEKQRGIDLENLYRTFDYKE